MKKETTKTKDPMANAPSYVKQGEQKLSDPVRLFQMRIAGKDKAIDTQRGVFIDPFGNGGGIAHQRGPGAAAR